MEPQKFAVFPFPSVSHAMKAEKILRDRGIGNKLIPIPAISVRTAESASASGLISRTRWQRFCKGG